MRRLVLIALATCILVSAFVGPASAKVPSAVTWKFDHVNKTITVSVKLLLYPSCVVSSSVRGDKCNVSEGIADRIRRDIEAVWNRNGKGYRYKCYRLIFEVDVKVDNSANRFTVPSDRVGVRIDKTSVNFRSFVSVAPGRGAWDSNDPADRTNPDNRATSPTTWAYPPRPGEGNTLYAHEFGHVIGLDDAYDDVTKNGQVVSQDKPGAKHDLMSTGGPDIDQTTIDRLIMRSGSESTLECDYKIDTTIEWFHFESIKCGTAEGKWDIQMTGVRDLGGGRLVAEGRADVDLDPPPPNVSTTELTGLWDANYRIDLEGVPLSTGGQAGTTGGDARFNPVGANLTLFLKATFTHGNFWAATPAASLSGAAQEQLKNLALPVTSGKYC